MKKRIVSLCSLTLALLILCMSVGASALTEEQAAKKGADVFNAWDVISHSNYHYMTTDYKSPYRMFVDDLKSNTAWNAALVAWRVATFDVKSEVEYATAEIGYYDAFLFNILYDSASQSLGTSFVSALSETNGDVQNMWEAISASTWQSLCELIAECKTNPDLNGSTVILDKNLAEELKKIDGISNAMDKIDNLGDYVGYCHTALELVEKIAKLEALLRNSEETALILTGAAERCSNNPMLKQTLENYRDFLSGTITKAEMIALFAGTATYTEIAKKMASELYKEVVKECSQYGLMVAVGQGAGKFTANALLNSSGTIAQYYKLQAMYQLEDLIKAETLSCQQTFENSPTPANAKKFIAAYRLLYKTYLEGLDCSAEFVKAVNKDGLYNKIKSWFRDDGSDALLKSIASIKNSVKFTLDYYESGSFSYYKDVLESLLEVGDISVYPLLSDLPGVEIDPDAQNAALVIASNQMGNLSYSKDTTLTGDLITYGSLTLSNGTLNLNGYSLQAV